MLRPLNRYEMKNILIFIRKIPKYGFSGYKKFLKNLLFLE